MGRLKRIGDEEQIEAAHVFDAGVSLFELLAVR